MKSFSSLFVCFLALSAAGCFAPDLADDTIYSCDTTADCGVEGLLCAPRAGLRGYCCQPTAEVCNGKDDDCDGQADELAATSCYGGPAGTAGKGLCVAGTPSCGANGEIICVGEVRPVNELCNAKDDDCDGVVDEDFDLTISASHCGRCGNACAAGFSCVSSTCQKVAEVCTDGLDNDRDNGTDCADTECNGQSCSKSGDPAACTCVGGKAREMVCGDGADNDGDIIVDCLDVDCDGKACNATLGGCVCANQAKTETICSDGKNNDGDPYTDCEDADCVAKECNLTGGCICENGAKKETICSDGVSNDDGDTLIDCADGDCSGKQCNATLGGCTCANNKATETVCNDAKDNDSEGGTDCADPDCNGKTCNKAGGGTGTCKVVSGTRTCN
ncbi:MAG TPA: MopE-related protein [Archangium sp.]|jgi:hypothetical protein|uniref:MopE-related protein n=1 Tax=Archangium sp. TaxID=1872627 RepID=UPI002ED7F6BD